MKKLISTLLASAMLLSSASMVAQAKVDLPQPFEGNFDIAYFGNNHPNYHTNSETWMKEVQKTLNEEGTTTGRGYGSFNFTNAWLNVGAMLKAKPELVLIDTGIMRNGGTGSGYMDGKYLENILLSLAKLENPPYVALIDGVDSTLSKDAPSYTADLGRIYNTDVINLADSGVDASCFTGQKANENAYSKYASYVVDNLTYKQIKMPNFDDKYSVESTDVSPQKVFSGKLTNEAKEITFYGSSISVKVNRNETDNDESIKVTIDSDEANISDPGGVAYSKLDLKKGYHTVKLTATGAVDIEGVYVDSLAYGNEKSYVGFEDNSIAPLASDNAQISLVKGGADGSSYAVDINNAVTNNEVKIPVVLEVGKEYNVSAKFKGISLTGSDVIFISHQYVADGNGMVTRNAGWATVGASGLKTGEWVTLSKKIKIGNTINIGGGQYPNATGSGTFAFRIPVGSDVLIDDIIIEPADEVEEVKPLNLTFDNQSYTQAGYNISLCKKPTSYIDDGKGGYAFRTTGLTGYDNIMLINGILMKPNGTYKMTFRAKAADSDSAGKYIQTIIDRNNSHKDSNGNTPKVKLDNYYYLPTTPIQLSDDWQEVTYYYNPTSNTITDEMGYANVYFRIYSQSASQGLGSDVVGIDIDDFSIEEINVPMGALWSVGQKPGGGLNWSYDAATDVSTFTNVKADLVLGMPIEHNAKYKMSFDIKGQVGNSVKSFLATNSANKWNAPNYIYGPELTFNGEWQTYTWTESYNKLDVHRYPQWLIRLTNTDSSVNTYSVKNVKCEKILDEGVYNISSDELKEGKLAKVSFSDYASNSKGYTYSIYSLNANGNKTIYESGFTTKNVIMHKVTAPAGTKLYASIAAANANNMLTAFASNELGTVFNEISECVVTAEFNDDDDVIGVVNVKNNDEARTVNVYIAQYDEDGNLLTCSLSNNSIAAYEETTIQVPIELDDDVVSLKMYTWDGNAKPYCDMIEYE